MENQPNHTSSEGTKRRFHKLILPYKQNMELILFAPLYLTGNLVTFAKFKTISEFNGDISPCAI